MDTLIRPLSKDEIGARDAGLELASRIAGVPRPFSISHVQALYDALLVGDATTENLIALGLAFGEQIILVSGFEWVRVSDEYGDETCVAIPGKQIFSAPISMIQKRIRRAEALDLVIMRDETVSIMRKRVAEGQAADR
jgi:hypothetical protein